MKKTFISLLLVLSVLFALCGCAPAKKPSETTTSASQPAAPSTSAPGGRTEKTSGSQTTQHSGQGEPVEVPEAPAMFKKDVPGLDDMIMDSVFLLSGDKAWIFAHPAAEAGWSEDESAYLFTISTGEVSGPIRLGTVGEYPSTIYEDGSVSVSISDPETYAFTHLVFLYPDLSTETAEFSENSEIYSVCLSRDKRYAAINTDDYTVLKDENGNVLLRVETDRADPQDPIDDRVPRISAFSYDSSQAVIIYQGWEWVYNSSIYDVEKGLETTLDQQWDWDTAAEPLGSKYIMVDMFSGLPLGVYDARTEVSYEKTPVKPDGTWFCYSAFGQDSAALCIAPESGEGYYIIMWVDQELNVKASMEAAAGLSFSGITVSPDGSTAALLTTHTVTERPSLYIVLFY